MIELKKIKKTYSTHYQNTTALDDINLKFPDTGFFAIIGETGCGKSTLINLISLFDTPTEGEIFIDGISTKDFSMSMCDDFRCNYLSYILQNISVFDLIPELTVKENIDLAFFLQNKEINKEKILDVLELLKIKEIYDKEAINLSGGQIQRVSIARAICRNPKLIIADEPVSSLDPMTKIIVIKFLKELSKTRLVIVVSHDMSIIKEVDGIVALKEGKLSSFRDRSDIKNYQEELYQKIEKENDTNKIFKDFVYDDKINENDINFNEINLKIENIVSYLNNDDKAKSTRLITIIHPKYMFKIIFNNLKNFKVRTVIETIVHAMIIVVLSFLMEFINYFNKHLHEIRNKKIIDFEHESVKMIVYYFKVIMVIVVIFSIFISLRSIAKIIKDNRQKIGILRSIGSNAISIFAIYFVEFMLILLLSLLAAQSFLMLATKSQLTFEEHMLATVIMVGYCILVASVSTIIPVWNMLKKSIINIIKKI